LRREDLQELHYITPISNVVSIMDRGILSHRRVNRIRHDSIAMQEIQDRRAQKIVPGGRQLDDYVNLYINARNKMMFRVKDQHEEICVLRIRPDILDSPDVVVTDQNASSSYVRFEPAPRGLQIVDSDLVFADSWIHDDQIATWRHGSIICAEVLVPDSVSPEYIIGAYVSCDEARRTFINTGVSVFVKIYSHMFFR